LNPGGNSTQVNSSNYHCYGNSDKYNYATVNLIMTPQERTGGFINGDYHLGDHVTAYVNAVYEKTSSNFQLAPAVYGTGTGVVVAGPDPVTGLGANAFNTFGQTFQTPRQSPDDLAFGSRLTTAGNRIAFSGRQDAQINTGFRGDFNVFDKNKTQKATGPKMPGGKAIPEPSFAKGKEYKVAPAPMVRIVGTLNSARPVLDALGLATMAA